MLNAWSLYSKNNLSLSQSKSLSHLSHGSLAFLAIYLFRLNLLSLSVINNYIHAYMCLTVGQQSAWSPTTDRVNLRWVFTKSFLDAWNVETRCYDSEPTVEWTDTSLSRWPFSDFFQGCVPKSLETSKNVLWQSADGRVDLRPLPRDRSADLFENFPKSACKR